MKFSLPRARVSAEANAAAVTLSSVRIILASSSPRRHDLLTMAGIAHEVMPADVDETHLAGEEPGVYAERVARDKGAWVAAREPSALIIAADTIVVVDGLVLGKPRDVSDAARMLRLLSGRIHQVRTATAIALSGRLESAVDIVDVKFRELTHDDIMKYIGTGEPADKAGAYGIQGYGATLVERIEGDFFAVMGLSLYRLTELMQRVGVKYEFPSARDAGNGA
ncbi:MAG: septum formation inhibitor Maf [Anaerolineae bacterium]|nr:septum formation inhibitor Maf [Gemmatimonadaceae bacterium]